MPLNLIQGPPNSGRAGRVRRALTAVLDDEPVLVVPNVDDVDRFQEELCGEGAVLGAEVTTFDGLFRAVATAGGTPPGPGLTPAQRLGAVAAAVGELRPGLRPLRGSASQPGFPVALERLLEELQGAGLEPAAVEAEAGTLEGSAYLGDVSTLFAGYAAVRDRLGLADRHAVARGAIELLGAGSADWWPRPVFIYGFDDLTRNQLDLIRALAAVSNVTVALPHERGNTVLEERTAPLLESLEEIGVADTEELEADPANTPEAPLLFHLERGFGAAEPARMPPDDSLVLLRSAGERGEAEAIGAAVARLLADGAEPEEIAIVVRDPGRRGPLLASVLESYGVPVALEAEISAGTTAVGGSLVALLDALIGSGRAGDLLRYLRGPSGASPGRVDWFERRVRRTRTVSATAALELWEEQFGELPEDVARVREAAARPAALAAAVAEMAAAMGARAGSELEARAAAAISTSIAERAELEGLAPRPDSLAQALSAIFVRIWHGPVGARVRIADPQRLRAARFDYVFVASLQDGEFPRGGATGADPFLSEAQRSSLGLPPRRQTEAEERYLFHACLALPRRRLFLSHRDSDENGAAEAPSPFLDEVRRLLEPAPGAEGPDPVEARVRSRDLARVVHRVGDAPSETELARAIAVAGADTAALLGVAGVEDEVAERIGARLDAAARAEAAGRAPGPLSNPAVIAALSEVSAYGGTTLEGFDVCSYRWFVSHELSPQLLDPVPDPLLQGGIVHEVLDTLYGERPGGDPLPRPGSLDAWIGRSRELAAAAAAAREMGGQPAERAMLRRIEGWLARFLAEEARREGAGFEPWLLEAGFSDAEETERPALEIDGWRLHGAVDRVDRAADGRALVLDYKLSASVTPREKLEEDAKLQLQLYLIAVAELWGAEAIGGIYLPLRGTTVRRPRGAVLEEEAADAGRLIRDLPHRRDRARGVRGAARRRPATGGRDRRPDARRADRPRSRAAARHARPRDLPSVLRVRADLPSRPGAGRAERRRGRTGRAMSGRVPTEEQRRAIETTAAEAIVEAGAGTGKTGVMVDRYCRLVCEQGVSPDAVLAFTFTDKAAAELRQRIRAEIELRAEAGSERARELLPGLGSAWVTTIHGFCNRLLAAHPVAIGIDPRFRVIDAPEAERAAGEAFDAALEEFLALGEEQREDTVAAFDVGGLRGMVVGAHAELRSRGAAEPTLPEPPAPDLPGALRRAADAAERAVEELKPGSANRELAERAVELLADPGRPPSLDQLASLRTGSRAKPLAEYREAIEAALSAVAEAAEGGRAYRHVGELLTLFSARFAAAKERRAGIDFEDLQILAARLLERTEAGSAYRSRFSHLLVDEFQDTNRLQLRLIEALRGPATQLMVVGDELQSIYGFRHADLDVFRERRGRDRGEPRRGGDPADRQLPLAAGGDRCRQRARREPARRRVPAPAGRRPAAIR